MRVEIMEGVCDLELIYFYINKICAVINVFVDNLNELGSNVSSMHCSVILGNMKAGFLSY